METGFLLNKLCLDSAALLPSLSHWNGPFPGGRADAVVFVRDDTESRCWDILIWVGP